MWTLTKDGRTVRLVLTTHSLGHELRLLVGVEFARSQVCKTPEAVATTADEWRTTAIAKGWAA